MRETSDFQLLQCYTNNGSEEAFAALSARYCDLVYSVAFRRVGNAHQAEEITQAVFIIMAKKAHAFDQNIILPGWLHRTTWFVADNFQKADQRRRQREQEAFRQSLLHETECAPSWNLIAPELDSAVAELSYKDRDAIILRYFEGKSLDAVGKAMGASEEAARKRVDRAVEKLRSYFARRGIAVSSAVLIAAISAHSVQAAPASLILTATGTTASSWTLMAVADTLRQMLWTKIQTAILIGGVFFLTAVVSVVGIVKDRSARAEAAFTRFDAPSLENAPEVLVLRPTRYPDRIDHGVNSGGKVVTRNMGLDWLLTMAYDFPWWRRVVLPPSTPAQTFDLLLSLSNDPKTALRAEISKQLGLVAHREKRRVDALLLQATTPTPPALHISLGGNRTSNFSGWYTRSNSGQFVATNQPMAKFAEFLEDRLAMPVLDQTGLIGNFDAAVHWTSQKDAGSENEEIKRAFLAQLGLQLVPSQEPLEMLVVEKVVP
jgi:uncharacterized protein (TIGR03435 family)